MHKAVAYLLMLMIGTAAGCRGAGVPDAEQPAPPDRFVVTTGAGRLTGAPARVDIKYDAADRPPQVELILSASDTAGRTWTARVVAPPGFLDSGNLSAAVVNRPLLEGFASVQASGKNGEAQFADAGSLSLRLAEQTLAGETKGAPEELSAKFEGPFVVTCAVPAADTGGPSASGQNSPPTLVVDERFESPLCRRHAALARRGP